MASSTLKQGIRCLIRLRQPKDVISVGGQLVGLLGSDSVDITGQKDPLHRKLANLPDDEEAVRDFVRRWGRVAGGAEPVKTLRRSLELMVTPLADATRKLREAHPETEEDWDAANLFSQSQAQILRLRNTLQKAWAGDARALGEIQNTVKEQVGASWAFKQRGVEITVQDAWAAACLLFLLDHAAGKIQICENPACLARFFIKKRKNQKSCADDLCMAYAVRTRTGNWWKEHGNEWRAERRKNAQKKARKGGK